MHTFNIHCRTANRREVFSTVSLQCEFIVRHFEETLCFLTCLNICLRHNAIYPNSLQLYMLPYYNATILFRCLSRRQWQFSWLIPYSLVMSSCTLIRLPMKPCSQPCVDNASNAKCRDDPRTSYRRRSWQAFLYTLPAFSRLTFLWIGIQIQPQQMNRSGQNLREYRHQQLCSGHSRSCISHRKPFRNHSRQVEGS